MLRLLTILVSILILTQPTIACTYDPDSGSLVNCDGRPTTPKGGSNTDQGDETGELSTFPLFEPSVLQGLSDQQIQQIQEIINAPGN